MKIAVLASEGAPFIKSGGLGDVMEALPEALANIPGNQVTLFLPYYEKIRNNPVFQADLVTRFYVALGWRQQYCGVWKLKNPTGGVQVYFLDNMQYFSGRTGPIYGYPDDGERFAYFSKACLDAMVALSFYPDVIHCNDWQTGLVPALLRAQYYTLFPYAKCVFTIHNIEYQGLADLPFLEDVLAFPPEHREVLTHRGSVNIMKGAIETAHAVTTVSKTYAKELMYPYYAHGLEGVLTRFSGKLTGITNGIDMRTFNPETDPALPARYNVQTFHSGKAICKAAVQKEVGLPQKPAVPLLVMVTRLAAHKGLDLLCAVAERLLQEDAQLLILGAGEEKYQDFFRHLAQKYPEKVSAQIAFDIALAARIYAGGDIYLMPSKSEPCGLSQMNAMRYGAVPVVHATGGLKDTVPGVDDTGQKGLGFTFQSYNAEDFLATVLRCLNLYRNAPEQFHALQKRDMEQDFSWDEPAQKYMALFSESF